MAADLSDCIAWVLNFGADREFEHPGYTPSHSVRHLMHGLRPRLRALLADGDLVLPDEATHDIATGYVGRAWCPTPSALRTLARAGASVPAAPGLEVLSRVNSRRFCAELGQCLPAATFVTDEHALRAAVERSSPTGIWLLKSAFSTSGSGRRLVRSGELRDEDARWGGPRLAHGLQVEPLYERMGDFALHGFLTESGTTTFGDPCVQRTADTGAWLDTVVAGPDDLTPVEAASLHSEGTRVAEALHQAGYFGPFNLDAFRYRTRAGSAFQPRCEINARYTMGWGVGMGRRRPDRS